MRIAEQSYRNLERRTDEGRPSAVHHERLDALTSGSIGSQGIQPGLPINE